MILPPDEDAAVPLDPGEEPLHDPPPLVPAQAASVLRLRPRPVLPVGRDHLDSLLPEIPVQRIAVIRLVTDQILREVVHEDQIEAQLDEPGLVPLGRVRPDGQWKAATVHDRHDLHAFSGLREPHAVPSALGAGERRVNERLRPVDHPDFPEFGRQILEHVRQHLVAAPRLESPVHRLVVRIALRQHVPLGPRLQNPKHGFQDLPRRHRRASPLPLRPILLGEMMPDPVPLVVRELQHAPKLTPDDTVHKPQGVFEIGSSRWFQLSDLTR